jgi:DNA repair protein RecN (Recombination protein N)
VLAELRVQNLLLIERAELLLHPGLNVITGETGAGKTVLAHALDLLLGGRPRRGIVRPGADEAYVEGVFTVPDGLAGDPELAALSERLPLDRGEAVLARRVTAGGRTRAYLDGRSVSAAELRTLGSLLLAFYGQHEHRKLMLASAQLEILDAYCGPEHLERRGTFERELVAARRLERDLAELRERAGMRERDLDLLEFEIDEIEQVAPSEEEELRLGSERARLAAAETLLSAAAAASAALDPVADEEPAEGALNRLSAAEAELGRAAGHDGSLDALAERCRSLMYEAQELGSELRSYREGLEAEPGRLEEVEERLDRLARLKRKHGGTIAAVLEHGRACRERRDELAGAEEALEAATASLAEAGKTLEARAQALHEARATAAGPLAESVRERLAALAMEGASFEVALSQSREPGPSGADDVEFLIAPNPGVPAGPLRDTASGGELSRVMLALMSVAAEAGAATLVFDEVDAGIGGQTARAVGEQLRTLAAGRQVICITHLPQIASLAERHFTIVKDASGETALTTVEQLESGAVVGELVRMLGADEQDTAARRHAKELLRAA